MPGQWKKLGLAYARSFWVYLLVALAAISHYLTARSAAAWTSHMPPVIWFFLGLGFVIPAIDLWRKAAAENAELRAKLKEQDQGFATAAARQYRELMFGPFAPVSAKVQIEEAEQEFLKLADAALAGDRSAAAEVAAFAATYMGLLRKWSPVAFEVQAGGVRERLEQIRKMYDDQG